MRRDDGPRPESAHSVRTDRPTATAAIEILVVEDSATQRQQLRHRLERHGYAVRVAADGKQALASLRQRRPAMVISDVVMPEMDGYELCRQIRRDPELAATPVILLTSLSDPENVIRGLECGADNFVLKPYKESFLLSRVQYVIVNQQLRARAMTEMGLEIFYAGRKHFVTSDRMQIIDLLLSTFEAAVQRNRDLERINREFMEAVATIQNLVALLPICHRCKRVRNDSTYLQQLAAYAREHFEVGLSTGLCTACAPAGAQDPEENGDHGETQP